MSPALSKALLSDDLAPNSPTQERIVQVCDDIKALLLRKNKTYGDSAVRPQNIFATGHPTDQIAVRCDDKLSRIRNMGGLSAVLAGPSTDGEDTVVDLIGYLVLAKVAADAHAVSNPQSLGKVS